MGKEKRPMIKITVGSLFYAMNTADENGQFDPAGFGEVIQSPVIKNVGVSVEAESTKVYSSGKIYGTRNANAGTDLAVEVLAFDEEDLYTLRGEKIEENGLVFGGGSNKRPFVAIGYPVIKDGGVSKFIWYPYCQLIENTEDIATSEDSFSEQNDTLTFSAMPFNAEGNTKVEIDTGTLQGKAATEEDFFKQVIVKKEDYTPGA